MRKYITVLSKLASKAGDHDISSDYLCSFSPGSSKDMAVFVERPLERIERPGIYLLTHQFQSYT